MALDNRPAILFIVNPNAGKRNARKLLRELSAFRSKLDVIKSERAGQILVDHGDVQQGFIS